MRRNSCLLHAATVVINSAASIICRKNTAALGLQEKVGGQKSFLKNPERAESGPPALLLKLGKRDIKYRV